MEAKLVYTNKNQRYYKLSKPLFIMHNGFKVQDYLLEEINHRLNYLKPEYKKPIKTCFDHMNKNCIDLICVSDSLFHIERLVFMAFSYEYKNKINYAIFMDQIMVGKYTMTIHGGDLNTIYEDKVYLRYLAKINNLKFEGIIK